MQVRVESSFLYFQDPGGGPDYRLQLLSVPPHTSLKGPQLTVSEQRYDFWISPDGLLIYYQPTKRLYISEVRRRR